MWANQILLEIHAAVGSALISYLKSPTEVTQVKYLGDIFHLRKFQGRKKPRSNCPGQDKQILSLWGQVKMEVWWPVAASENSLSRQVASDNLQSKIISKLKAAR